MANSANSVFGAGATAHPLDGTTRIYAADAGTDGVGYITRTALQAGLNDAANTDAKSAYGAGTSYQLTTTPAAVVLGTTNPTITLGKAGTYLIIADVVVDYNGATFAAGRDVIAKIRRTNNTAADLTGGARTIKTNITTTETGTLVCVSIAITYTTTATDDALTIFGSVSALPSAGSLDISDANIIATLI